MSLVSDNQEKPGFLQSKEAQSMTMIVISCLLLIVVIYFASSALSKKNIIPDKSERYDITEVYVGLVEEVCPPVTAEAPLRASKYEDCIKDLSLKDGERSEKWAKMTIPDVDWILDNYRPSFGGTLKKADERVWKAIYKDLKPSVVAFEVPEELFSDDTHDWNFNRLVFSHARNGIICIGGRCDGRATEFRNHGQAYPLITKESFYEGVFTFISHIERPYSIDLRLGVFVASEKILSRFHDLYGTALSLETISFSLLFFSLFFLILWQSVLWKKYLDYSSFGLFVVGLSTFAYFDNSALSMYYLFDTVKTNEIFFFHMQALSLIIFVASSIFFTFSFTRNKKINFLRQLAFPVVVCFCASSIYFLRMDYSRLTIPYRHLETVAGIIIFAFPLIISIRSIYEIRMGLNSIKNNRISEREALRKRLNQQVILLFAMLAFSFTFVSNSILYISGHRIISKFNIASVIAVMTMGVLLFHPAMVRLSRVFSDNYPNIEVGRLKLLLSPKSFFNWAKAPKSGVFVEIDILGSSNLTPLVRDKLHYLINLLEIELHELLDKSNFFPVYQKTMGDALLVVINSEHDDLAKDVEEFTRLLALNASRFEKIVEDFVSEFTSDSIDAGLHFVVFACERYHLAPSDEKLLTPGALNVANLDFISEEMNFLMKDAPKVGSSSIVVCGRERHINNLLTSVSPIMEHPCKQTSERELNLKIFQFGVTELVNIDNKKAS